MSKYNENIRSQGSVVERSYKYGKREDYNVLCSVGLESEVPI